MKHTLFSFVCILASFHCFAQSSTDTIPHLQLKKGIYFSFKEITTQQPARTDSFTVVERTAGQITMMGGGKYGFDLAADDKADYKQVKKTCVGISDGENFYISDKFTIGGWQGLTRCLLSGPYIIAPISSSAGQYTGGGIIPAMIKVNKGFLINLNDGVSRPLSKKLIREILKKYPDIEKEYADKNNLVEFAVEIINKVNQLEKLK